MLESVESVTVDVSKYMEEDPTSNKGREKEDGYLMSYGLKWCVCEERHESNFHENTEEMKHHYTCSVCGFIVQVG